MHDMLNGTLPINPFDPDGFVGTVESDGQRPHVAALACEPDGRVICLSLIGAANSVSSALATLLDPKGRLRFEPAGGRCWEGSCTLMRDPQTRYRELGVRLPTTLATHGLCLPISAHLGDGLIHPPVLAPDGPARPLAPAVSAEADRAAIRSDSLAQLRSALAHAPPRYLFGNWHEPTPNRRSFLGVLRGIRVIFVHAPPGASPALSATMAQWADALWREGHRHGLIGAIPCLGIRAWRLSGDLGQWSDLVTNGVRQRWLNHPHG